MARPRRSGAAAPARAASEPRAPRLAPRAPARPARQPPGGDRASGSTCSFPAASGSTPRNDRRSQMRARTSGERSPMPAVKTSASRPPSAAPSPRPRPRRDRRTRRARARRRRPHHLAHVAPCLRQSLQSRFEIQRAFELGPAEAALAQEVEDLRGRVSQSASSSGRPRAGRSPSSCRWSGRHARQ